MSGAVAPHLGVVSSPGRVKVFLILTVVNGAVAPHLGVVSSYNRQNSCGNSGAVAPHLGVVSST